MNIFLFNNGTKYLDELRRLLGKYGQTSERENADIIVLSGGHQLSVAKHPESYTDEIELIKSASVPILGICLGAEMIAYAFGATLTPLEKMEKGLIDIEIVKNDGLFSGITNFKVYENHKWAITKLSDNLEGLARSESGFEIIKHKTKPIYGFQFHPEMCEDKGCGDEIFDNFFKKVSGPF